MQQGNHQQTASTHDRPAAVPPELPAAARLPAASAEAVAPTNGATKGAPVLEAAWSTLRSTRWMTRIADSTAVRVFVNAVKKARDDIQAKRRRDDAKRS
jgi:hypothetical protein